jgi:hypothetical protein
MPTPQNTSNKRDSKTAKSNYTAVTYGNDHGALSFGHIHKPGDVISDVMLQASDGRHQFSMDKDGQRKGWTTFTNPGAFQVQCAYDLKKDQNALFLEAVNGDIIIKATNGRVRIEGLDVDITAKGPDNTQGNIRCTANEGIMLDAKNITISGSSSYKLITSGQAQITANTGMKIYSAVIRGVTDAVANKDSKVGGRSFQKQQVKT